MRPCSYFQSKEFYRNVAIIGTQSTVYLAAIATQGFTIQNTLALIFGGIFGGLAIAKGDLDINKNLYTPPVLPHRNPEEAIANCAKTIAIQTAVSQVLGEEKSDVASIASSILQEKSTKEIIDNQPRVDMVIRAIGKLL